MAAAIRRERRGYLTQRRGGGEEGRATSHRVHGPGKHANEEKEQYVGDVWRGRVDLPRHCGRRAVAPAVSVTVAFLLLLLLAWRLLLAIVRLLRRLLGRVS